MYKTVKHIFKRKFLLFIILIFSILISPVHGEKSNTGSLENNEKIINTKIKNKNNNPELIKKSEENIKKLEEKDKKLEENIKKEEKNENIRKERTIEELEKDIIGSGTIIETEKILKKQENKEENIVINAYKTKKEQIFDLIKKTAEEEKIDYTNKILKNIKTEKELNQKIYEELKQDIQTFNNLKKELKIKEDKIKKLENIKNKTTLQIKKLEIEKRENIKYKIIAKNNQREIERKKIAIEQSMKEIKKKEGLEERYKKLIEELIIEKTKNIDKENEKLMEKLNVLYIFIGIIILLYFFRFLILNHTNFKKKHTKIVTIGELFLGILVVGFGIWYFFYLFPNLYILVIFLSGYLLLVNAHLIASFMGSLIVVNKYSVGEMVKIDGYLGKITKIGTIYTIISEIDEKGFMHQNYKYIPNVIIVREGLEKIKDYTVKQRTFSIKLRLNKQNTIFKIIEHIKYNILLKHINSRPKHLESENNDVFEIKYEQEKVGEVQITFFWFSTEEISKRIKSRIIGYIEKETCEIEENNFDDEIKKEVIKKEKKSDEIKFLGV